MKKQAKVLDLTTNEKYQDRSEPRSIIIWNNLVQQVNYALESGMPLKQIESILKDTSMPSRKVG